MGKIAEMMLDGILDEQTGEFIDDELSAEGGPGYPRTMERREKRLKARNSVQSYNGISNFINHRYPGFIDYKGNPSKAFSDTHRIIRAFLRHKAIKHKKLNKFANVWRNAGMVQNHFNEFKVFLKEYIKDNEPEQ